MSTKKNRSLLTAESYVCFSSQLVSYIYDIGISACINNDKIKLNKVLTHLKETLTTVPIQEKYLTPFPPFMIIFHFWLEMIALMRQKIIFYKLKHVWKEANQLHLIMSVDITSAFSNNSSIQRLVDLYLQRDRGPRNAKAAERSSVQEKKTKLSQLQSKLIIIGYKIRCFVRYCF